MSTTFGDPDPGLALPPAASLPQKPGPLHTVEFVIEVVGPKSIPAEAASALLQPNWFQALGEPHIWVMAPQDTAWQPLTGATTGSFDSLALSWPLLGAKGHLTHRSVLNLVGTAERFAGSVQRRALPMPPPVDVDGAARAVADVVEALDIGVSLGVEFVECVAEELIWRASVALGLSLNSVGEFVWGDPPQLVVLPLNEPSQFTLGAVRSGRTHQGLSIGFSVPQVADPNASMEAAFQVAIEYARRFRGLIIDEDGSPMTDRKKSEYVQNIQMALQAFKSASLTPGSAEALRLFGE